MKILGVTDATYGGKAIRMETPNRRKLIAYDQHSDLQLANVGEVWDIEWILDLPIFRPPGKY